MATTLTPSVVANPLSDFEVIGHNTYLYTPESYTASSPLILFFSWMGAGPKHIAKYTVVYRRLFPNARIVLVRNFVLDAFSREFTYRSQQKPAREIVHEHIKSGGEVLVHHSSNGGGIQAVEFAKGWKTQYDEVLPMRAQIVDSGPGRGDWKRSHAAISQSLPKSGFWKMFGSAVIHLGLAFIFIFNKLAMRGNDNMMVAMSQEMNDPGIFNSRTPRVYLYSKADRMVKWEDVEGHADEAATKGWDVKKVRFETSPHVGHILEDEGKYWGAIADAWESGS
ncbi:hypothetical protein K504DRAFT_456904 [Pleomassaria siparia CBS 279.74]|uniref:DUF829-domain-containing protein n=1 Tax=Pleomassaria siparia CBS 279.74 TaxID=1314801 RepID=A0A6G1KPE1_9PLEO|nr:hypothetical protein K504DRAFT_456904 [Pleomassaria siparia CBS 279.74]